jgi:hypothetical protein
MDEYLPEDLKKFGASTHAKAAHDFWVCIIFIASIFTVLGYIAGKCRDEAAEVILDRTFRYTKSHDTDVRATWQRAREQQQKQSTTQTPDTSKPRSKLSIARRA